MRARVSRVLAAAWLMLGALSGCTLDSGVGRDARFDAAVGAAQGDALVVVGMRLVREPTMRSLFLGEHTFTSFFLMNFVGLDEANHLTPVRRTLQVCDLFHRGTIGNLVAPCDPTVLAYRVFRVPAGHYVLNDFEVHGDRFQFNTNFLGAKEVLPFGHPPSVPPKQPTVVAFAASAGEITYIGDFNWDPQPFPAVFALTRDDAAARAALSAYPGLSAPIVFRPVTLVPVVAYPRRPT